MGGKYGAIESESVAAKGSATPSSSAFTSAASSPQAGAARDHEHGSLLAQASDAAKGYAPEEAAEGERTAAGGIFGKGSRRMDNSRLVTIFLVLNYMIGSGILNTPQTFRDSGLIATTLLYMLACSAVWLGAVVLIEAAEITASPELDIESKDEKESLDDLEFAALAARTLGDYGPAAVDGSIVVQNFGAVCSYVILVGGLSTSLLAEWSGAEESEAAVAWWRSFYFVAPIMVFVFVLPPCLIRHFSNLRWLSTLSLVAIAAVVCLVVCGSLPYADAERALLDGDDSVDSPLNAPLLWWNWTGSFAKMGSVVFALTCAPAALHSYTAMNNRTESEWTAVAGASVAAGGSLCYFTGLVGYVAFRAATEGDILDNFHGPLAACFKILVIVHLVVYIPNEVVILRHSLFTLAGGDVMTAKTASVASVTVGILVLIVAVVVALMLGGVAQGDLFGYILDLTGGVTASLTSFVVPALAYLEATNGLKVEGNNRVAAYRMGCKVLRVFGAAVMVIVPVGVIVSGLRK